MGLIIWLVIFFAAYSGAQYALERFGGGAWPKGTGNFPDPKFFYGPALATVVLLVLTIIF